MAKSIYDLVPQNARKIIGKSSKLCPLSSNDILKPLKDEKVIIIACNARIKHAIPGIMRAAKELDAVISFELAKSEGNLKGIYTGMTHSVYTEAVFDYVEKEKYNLPFFIHDDHIITKSPAIEVIEDSRALIKTELDAIYTSIGGDAVFNSNHDSIKVSADSRKHTLGTGAELKDEVEAILSNGVEARKLSKDILGHVDKKISKKRQSKRKKSKDKKSSELNVFFVKNEINGNGNNKISTDRIGSYGYSSENRKKSDGNLFTKTVKFIKSIKKTIHLLF